MHEAGHAVVSYQVNLLFIGVRIVRDESHWEGHIEYGDSPLDLDQTARSRIVAFAAGPLAELRYLGYPEGVQNPDREVSRLLDEAWSDDYRKMWQGAQETGLSVEELDVLTRESYEVVSSNWPLIEEVSQELVKRSILAYDDVKRIIESK